MQKLQTAQLKWAEDPNEPTTPKAPAGGKRHMKKMFGFLLAIRNAN